MQKNLDKVSCPDLPDWLEETARNMDVDAIFLIETTDPILNIYALFHRAKNGCKRSAEEMALNYEIGKMPVGVDLNQAILWHQYAAEMGSVSSCLRLTELLIWMDGRDVVTESMSMAANVIELVLSARYHSKDELCKAASAALFLLARTPNQEYCALIDRLLSHAKFANHPDFAEMDSKLHGIKCQLGNEKLSLKVAQSNIVEDGEFKAGIYKCLEKPLPLVQVSTNPEAIRNILNQEFPWFHKVNELIYRQMVALQFCALPAFRLRPLLIAGLPGVGKTTWAKRLAEICQVPFRTVMAGGGADAMYLRGLARGWTSSRPGAVIQTIAIEGVANPMFLIDELEKSGSSNTNGRIIDVLLQLVEPATSKIYLDECLQVPCDLSWVSWIATVNELGALPKPLLDRFTVVLVEPPDTSHFMTIVEGSLRSIANEFDIDPRMLNMLDGNDYAVLRKCKSPREINRTVRMMVEEGLVKNRQAMRH